MNRPFFFQLLLFALMTSCNSERVQNTKEMAQEVNERKIKRVTAAQLNAAVDEWGKVIVAIAQKSLTAELTKTSGNPAHAKALCQSESLPAVRSLEKKYGTSIGLLSANDVSNKELYGKERELLEAYLYNAQRKLPQSDNVQKLNDTLFVYNAAVPANSVICTVCADSAALPFVVWRVLFSKREVIRRIDPKKVQ